MSSQNSSDKRPWPMAALIGLFLLRVVIGWHFLYEGLVKLFHPGWTAAGYLKSSSWLLSDLFHWMAASPTVLYWVDLLNIWGLIAIGAGLMLGVLTRAASIAGVVLLLLYYVAHPPLVGMSAGMGAEGSYLVINKNVVEMAALLLLAIVPPSGFGGLGRCFWAVGCWIGRRLRDAGGAGEAPLHEDPEGYSRRELLATLANLPIMGGFVYAVLRQRAHRSREEKALQSGLASANADALSGATHKIAEALTLDQLKAKIPHAKIGPLQVSRLIPGSNLMNGFAHARDLMYVSPLVKAYHTVEKVLGTLWLAEQCGMNTLIINTIAGGSFIEEYRKHNVGGMQFIAQCRTQNLMKRIQRSIDLGVVGAYIQQVENLLEKDRFDEVVKAMEFMRQNGLVAGLGSHNLSAIKTCVERGIEPDFCMKTFHHYNYWSARPNDELMDNRYCDDHDETVEFMKTFDKPWIAFKTLAAGAIHPKDGFRHAFEHGADFICVGVYDFQVVEDCNIATDILSSDLKRERPWQGLA